MEQDGIEIEQNRIEPSVENCLIWCISVKIENSSTNFEARQSLIAVVELNIISERHISLFTEDYEVKDFMIFL